MRENFDNKHNMVTTFECRRDNYIAILGAWKKVKRLYKKDGTPFKVLSKNFEGCKFATPYYSNDKSDLQLKIHIRTPFDGIVEDEIYLYRPLESLPTIENREILRNYGLLTLGEIEHEINKKIEWYENTIKKYNRYIENIDNYFNVVDENLENIVNTLKQYNNDDERSIYYAMRQYIEHRIKTSY